MSNVRQTLSELYFDQLDVRDRIFNRLQFNYAIYTTAFAIIAYMFRMTDYSSSIGILILFYFFLFISMTLVIVSASLTWRSMTGYKYANMPKAKDIIKYGAELRKRSEELKEYNYKYNQNVSIPDPDIKLDEYIQEAMSDCIDINYSINEYRRVMVRKSLLYILYAAIPFGVSTVVFVACDLDVSSPRKIGASYAEGSPLIDGLNGVVKSISEIPKSLNKEVVKHMATENENKTPTTTPPPPLPPAEPEKPKLQYSTEDFKSPIPDKSKILNESK